MTVAAPAAAPAAPARDDRPDFSPHVALGLKAGALALRARSGKRVTLPDVQLVAADWLLLLPADTDFGAALARFMAGLGRDPVAAGAGLIDFLCGWRCGFAGRHMARAEAVLAGIAAERASDPDAPPPAPAWTRRADCGLD